MDLRVLRVGGPLCNTVRSETPSALPPLSQMRLSAETCPAKQLREQRKCPPSHPAQQIYGSSHPHLGKKGCPRLPSIHTFRMLFWLSSLPRVWLLFFET